MITSWDIYWLTRLDEAGGFFAVLGVLTFVATLLIFVWQSCLRQKSEYKSLYNVEERAEFVERADKIIPWVWKAGALGIIIMFVSTLIPTTKQAAAIYLLPKIANNEQVQKIPDNAMKLLNGKMEEWIADIGKKK